MLISRSGSSRRLMWWKQGSRPASTVPAMPRRSRWSCAARRPPPAARRASVPVPRRTLPCWQTAAVTCTIRLARSLTRSSRSYAAANPNPSRYPPTSRSRSAALPERSSSQSPKVWASTEAIGRVGPVRRTGSAGHDDREAGTGASHRRRRWRTRVAGTRTMRPTRQVLERRTNSSRWPWSEGTARQASVTDALHGLRRPHARQTRARGPQVTTTAQRRWGLRLGSLRTHRCGSGPGKFQERHCLHKDVKQQPLPGELALS